jgi:glycopeptide antibiotics resistance protein
MLLLEAFVVGVLTVVVGTIVGYVIGRLFSNNLPKICKEWNKNHIMEICLFLTGFIIHILCELTGINKWYCKNGNACKR